MEILQNNQTVRTIVWRQRNVLILLKSWMQSLSISVQWD